MQNKGLLTKLNHRTFGQLVTSFVFLFFSFSVQAQATCASIFKPLQVSTIESPMFLKTSFSGLVASVQKQKENQQDYVEVVRPMGLENTYLAIFTSQQLMNIVLDRATSYLSEGGRIRSHISIVYPRRRSMETVGHDLQASLIREYYKKYQEQAPTFPLPKGERGQKRLKMEEQFWEEFILPTVQEKPNMILIAVSLDLPGKELIAYTSHELLHAAYYGNAAYRSVVRDFWNQLSETEKDSIRQQLEGYNHKNEELMMNEFQAYVLQTHANEGLLKKLFGKHRKALLQELEKKNLSPQLL